MRWTADVRVMFSSSYGYNGWLYPDLYKYYPAVDPREFSFTKDNFQNPSTTPIFMDAMWGGLTPKESNPPSRDLYGGIHFEVEGGIGLCTIARHGSGINPSSAPRRVPPGQKMAGAINMSLADGHAQLVKLEDLWSFYWHPGWQTPTIRPP